MAKSYTLIVGEEIISGTKTPGWFRKYMIRNEPLSDRAIFYLSGLCTLATASMWAILETYALLHGQPSPRTSHNTYEDIIFNTNSLNSHRVLLGAGTAIFGAGSIASYIRMRRIQA